MASFCKPKVKAKRKRVVLSIDGKLPAILAAKKKCGRGQHNNGCKMGVPTYYSCSYPNFSLIRRLLLRPQLFG